MYVQWLGWLTAQQHLAGALGTHGLGRLTPPSLTSLAHWPTRTATALAALQFHVRPQGVLGGAAAAVPDGSGQLPGQNQPVVCLPANERRPQPVNAAVRAGSCNVCTG